MRSQANALGRALCDGTRRKQTRMDRTFLFAWERIDPFPDKRFAGSCKRCPSPTSGNGWLGPLTNASCTTLHALARRANGRTSWRVPTCLAWPPSFVLCARFFATSGFGGHVRVERAEGVQGDTAPRSREKKGMGYDSSRRSSRPHHRGHQASQRQASHCQINLSCSLSYESSFGPVQSLCPCQCEQPWPSVDREETTVVDPLR